MPSDGEWFECGECGYATNSPRRAEKHQDDTGHSMIVYGEDGGDPNDGQPYR